MTDIPLLVAAAAGVVSFLSPCVLPLIPGYLAYLSGATLGQEEAPVLRTGRRLTIFLNSVCFTLGFSLVFAALGVLLNTLLEAVAYDVSVWLSRIGGAIIVLFGLYLIGVLKLSWLARPHTLSVRTTFRSRYFTSFVFGAAFAAGWTPCVGAVLGAILGLAAAQPGSAFSLLLAYSVGFSIPFLLVGLFTEPATRLIARYGAAATVINKLFGLLLVGLGLLIFSGNLQRIANFGLLSPFLGQ